MGCVGYIIISLKEGKEINKVRKLTDTGIAFHCGGGGAPVGHDRIKILDEIGWANREFGCQKLSARTELKFRL